LKPAEARAPSAIHDTAGAARGKTVLYSTSLRPSPGAVGLLYGARFSVMPAHSLACPLPSPLWKADLLTRKRRERVRKLKTMLEIVKTTLADEETMVIKFI